MVVDVGVLEEFAKGGDWIENGIAVQFSSFSGAGTLFLPAEGELGDKLWVAMYLLQFEAILVNYAKLFRFAIALYVNKHLSIGWRKGN